MYIPFKTNDGIKTTLNKFILIQYQLVTKILTNSTLQMEIITLIRPSTNGQKWPTTIGLHQGQFWYRIAK